jgi:hypothetical protein
MANVITLRPETDRGREILDEVEARTEMRPTEPVADDGTRRYYLHAVDADVDALEPVLDKIDRDWHSHVTIWRDI